MKLVQQSGFYCPITSQNHRSGADNARPPHWLRHASYTAHYSCPSIVGCLSCSHGIGTQRDRGLAEASGVQYNASVATNVEYPMARMKKTGTTEQTLLTNHEPDRYVRRRPFESATLVKPLIKYGTSLESFSG
uniref:Uncharacterized protein n=1 Tax=Mesocestoides corti TaxID=53468 RepID=A0A5K3FW24_MESCO